MKNWIMELCPEIVAWQAELIAEKAQKRVLAEREACAQVCEEVLEQYRGTDMGKHAELVGDDCAAAIRAREQDSMPLFDDWNKDWTK
jgi:hypothetical protein